MKIKQIILSAVSTVFVVTLCLQSNYGQNKSLKTEKTATPSKQTKTNSVCPEPDKPCHHSDREFENWELSFRLPKKLVANKEYKSVPFYAVILKKIDEGCNTDGMDFDTKIEDERIEIQKNFPSLKVFAEYSCPNLDAVGYDFEGKLDKSGEMVLYTDYIAVYAGGSEEEGKNLLETIRRDYPKAELKKMTAVYQRIEM